MCNAFFLGANSGRGFHSFYDDMIDLKTADAVYILKGSPGSGKSSVMRRIAEKASETGEPFELIYCSSDPKSLDAVILPRLRRAVVDGTAPHVVEPRFPLAVERYVNLGDFADIGAINAKRDIIIETKEKYSAFFPHVYRLCECALRLENELFDIALGAVSTSAVRRRANGIISREIKGHGSGGTTLRRFTSAISPEGYINLLDGAYFENMRVYAVEDNFALGHFLLSPVKKAAEARGFFCFAVHNPLDAARLEHLIIPELSLAFITTDKQRPFDGATYRRIRLDNMLDAQILKKHRSKISFYKKERVRFIGAACDELHSAKLVHDELEALYNPHINFDALYAYADYLTKNILKD